MKKNVLFVPGDLIALKPNVTSTLTREQANVLFLVISRPSSGYLTIFDCLTGRTFDLLPADVYFFYEVLQ